MASGGFPKEPRQLMINLMYLVLTALLALNVSAEILHAFHVVNSGLDVSSIAESEKNAQTFAAFNEQLKNDKDRTQKYYDRAMQAKKLSDVLYDSIEYLKRQMIIGSGGINDNVTQDKMDLTKDPYKTMPVSDLMKKGELEDDRNLEISTNLMINKGYGDKLKTNINKLRGDLLSLVDDPNAKKDLQSQVPLKADDPTEKMDGVLKNWSETNFEMVPSIAAITLLNKFQNDIRNSEGLIVEYLLKQVNAKTVVVDKIQAKVIAPTSYVMQGQQYKADIFVAAYSSTVSPKVYIGTLNYSIATKDPSGNFNELTENPVVGGGKEVEVSNGMGHYEVGASGEGEQRYSGAAMILGPDGKPRYYPFDASYQTAKGAAVIASDNLNIIYAGIPNPFSVSVPGFAAEKVSANVSAGSFTKKSAGKFEALMPATMVGKKINISVSVSMDQGSKQIGAPQEYIVKRIPDPQAQIAGYTEGDIPVNVLKTAPGIGAVLKDFYFQGVQFSVTSFECVYIPRRQDAKIEKNSGAKWSGKVSEFMGQLKPGDQIIFRKINAIGPDKTTRSLSPIPLVLK